MLGFEPEELFLLQETTDKMTTRATVPVNQMFVAFMLCSFIGRDTPLSGE
jgi:hypothetical protein